MTCLSDSIETLVSTHTAVSIDNDSQHKIQFKLYLETAVVSITTLATGLGNKEEHPDFMSGSTDDVCHKILSNLMKKNEFVKSLNTNDDPVLHALLHWFANSKMETIRQILFTYQHMANLFNYEFYDRFYGKCLQFSDFFVFINVFLFLFRLPFQLFLHCPLYTLIYFLILYHILILLFINRMATLGTAGCDLDIQLEKFITMLYTCESAVYLDTIPTRKQTFKKYLISAAVPITTIVKALGFIKHQPLDTQGPIVKETCQNFLRISELKLNTLNIEKKCTGYSNPP